MNAPVKVKSQRSESKNSPECRIAFPYLHEKRTKRADGQPLKAPRYDAVFLLPKLTNDAATCPNYKFLSDLLMEAAGKMWPGHGWPQGAIWPIKDGDQPYVAKPKPGVTPKTPEQIAEANKWRAGHWAFEATHNLDPGPRVAIVQNGQAVEIPAKVVNGVALYKSGDYGIVHLHAYTYQNEQFGANLGFEGVLFTRPGEAIGSSGPRSAEQMFGQVAGTVPTPPPNAGASPAPGQAPPPPPTVAPQYAPNPPGTPPGAVAPPVAPLPPMPPGPR